MRTMVNRTLSQERAREIMGRNFFGIEEAVEHFGVNPSKQQLAALAEVPYSSAVLEELKDTHVSVAVFPLSILDIQGKVAGRKLLYYDQDQSWYNGEVFVEDRSEASWHLVRGTPVPDSARKNWNEQLSLLDQEDEVPTAHVMVYTIIGHYLATGERLFGKLIYVRTSSAGSAVGYRVYLGDFDEDGLDIEYWWDDTRTSHVGVAASRKSLSLRSR